MKNSEPKSFGKRVFEALFVVWTAAIMVLYFRQFAPQFEALLRQLLRF